MSLDQLKPGQIARIVALSGAGDLRRRLFDLGIRPGEIVRMIKSAPFYDPLQISIRNSHIALRRKEASFIRVEFPSDDSGDGIH